MDHAEDKAEFEGHPLSTVYDVVASWVRRLDGYDGSIAFILQIDPEEFFQLRGVGPNKTTALLELQEELRVELGIEAPTTAEERGASETTARSVHDPAMAAASERTRLNRALLSKSETNLMRLLTRRGRWDGSVPGLLMLSDTSGRAQGLSKFQERLREDLNRPWEDTAQHITGSLCVSDVPRDIPESVLEGALQIDFERFASSQSDRDRDLLLTRWGYAQERRTLKQLAQQFGTTESRMSQLEKKLREGLKEELSLSPELIRANVDRVGDRSLALVLPKLRSLFVDEEFFLRFLERCSDYAPGTLVRARSAPKGRMHSDVLHDILAYNASPIPVEQVLDTLISETGISSLQTTRCLEKWREDGRIEVTREGVWPGRVTPGVVVANELLRHPNGLPWGDAVSIVRARQPHLLANDIRGDTFRKCQYLYSLGKGFFRHRVFLELDEEDAELILPQLRAELGRQPTKVVRIARLAEAIPDCRGIPYFDLRCLVADNAERYGMYFKGQSRGDSLSLDPDAKGLNSRQAVLDILRAADEPLTRIEIDARLKRGRGGAASAALSALVREGQVVHVQKQLYTLRSVVLRRVDLDAVRAGVISVVEADERPLEADVLRVELDRELGVTHSKYVWALIASEIGRSRGWTVRRSLVCNGPIEHAGLEGLYSATGDFGAPFAEQVAHLRSLCRVTESVTHGWFRGWVSRRAQAIGRAADQDAK